jgi:hypothetical protein
MAKVYDGKLVSIIFGVIPISSIGGYGDSEFCTWKQTEDSFTTKVGADGTITRSATNCRLAEMEVTLMQSSPCNIILSGIWILDTSTPGGAGILPFTIADIQGTSLFLASNAWVMGPPEVKYAKVAEVRVWKFQGEIATAIIGGN